MIAKKSITVAVLQEKIQEIFIKAEAETKSQEEGAVNSNTLLRLDKDDIFHEHIEIINSMWEDGINVQWSESKRLSIKGLKIINITRGILTITSPSNFINELTIKDIEFNYIENNDAYDHPTPLMSLDIITEKLFEIELIRCTTNNIGMLAIQYNIPDKDNNIYNMKVQSCNFCNFCIITKPKELDDAKIPHKVDGVSLDIELDANIFRQFHLGLAKDSEYKYSMNLINGNDIQIMMVLIECPNVMEWGTREKIGENIAKDYKTETKNGHRKRWVHGMAPIRWAKKKITNNKEALIRFRKLAIDKGDKFQESTINYHIAKCDEQLIGLEYSSPFSQNKAIMFLGRLLSRHGTSWLRPLAWIVSINFIASIIIFHILNDSVCQYVIKECSFWYIFGEIFNPLSTPTGIAEGIKGDGYEHLKGPYIGVAISVLLSKAFYAMCIYEFVRAARRFTLK